MLRIGQFTDTFLPVVDGVGRVAYAYADTLCRLGHQVTVVTLMNDTGFQGGYPFQLVEFRGTSVPGLRQYKLGEAVLDAHYRKRIRMVDLDICHAHSPFMAGTEALRLAALRKLPLVASFHSKFYEDFLRATKSESLARVGVKMVVNFYNRCDEVWAVGKNAAGVLAEYGFEGEVQIMPNGAEFRAVSDSDIAEVNHRWHLGDDPMLLFVGQMDWKKNILTVLEACVEMKRQGFFCRTLLAGQGMDLSAIQEKILEWNLEDRVETLGHISDATLLDALYARASLFVFPSLYDNSPMVVREAAVMRTPSVMVRGSTAAEVIRDRENGYLCENTAADVARVIRRAISDPEELRRVGEQARETIPVPWEKVMEMAVARYEHLHEMAKAGRLKDKRKRMF